MWDSNKIYWIKSLESSWKIITSNKKFNFSDYWKHSALWPGTACQSKTVLPSAPNKRMLKEKSVSNIFTIAFQRMLKEKSVSNIFTIAFQKVRLKAGLAIYVFPYSEVNIPLIYHSMSFFGSLKNSFIINNCLVFQISKISFCLE